MTQAIDRQAREIVQRNRPPEIMKYNGFEMMPVEGAVASVREALAMRAKEQSHSPTALQELQRLGQEFDAAPPTKATGDDVEQAIACLTTLLDYSDGAFIPMEPAIREAAQTAIATLSPNGVSQPAAEERIARLSLDVGRLLAADPICGGRVSGGTVQAIAALATQPASDTGLREALDRIAKNAIDEMLYMPVGTRSPKYRIDRKEALSILEKVRREIRTTLETASDDGGSK